MDQVGERAEEGIAVVGRQRCQGIEPQRAGAGDGIAGGDRAGGVGGAVSAIGRQRHHEHARPAGKLQRRRER